MSMLNTDFAKDTYVQPKPKRPKKKRAKPAAKRKKAK